MGKRKWISFSLGAVILFGVGTAVYAFPPVHDRVAWRVEGLVAQIRYALDPPDQVIFIPQEQVEAAVQATLQALAQTPSPSPQAFLAPSPSAAVAEVETSEKTPASPGPTSIPEATATPAPTATPLPGQVVLSGIRHEYQSFNNCGPATLSMALSFWNWTGDQHTIRAALRPHTDDYNIMPEEMVEFVLTQTSLKALSRVGGDIQTLKRLLAAGFPVVIEKGIQPSKEWWMGHYALVSGYKDDYGFAEPKGAFITQDSYVMADLPVLYADIEERWWRDFNYVYVVIYPLEREGEVFSLLGEPSVSESSEDARWKHSLRAALARAEAETAVLQDRDLFFAWYNKGSSLVGLGDYTAASAAYDQAFALYPQIAEKDRPWRMLWYQVGPYPAYYYTGRYHDVINLANTTLGRLNKGGLEESVYWRGMARAALGDEEAALDDFKLAARLNENFKPALEELNQREASLP